MADPPSLTAIPFSISDPYAVLEMSLAVDDAVAAVLHCQTATPILQAVASESTALPSGEGMLLSAPLSTMPLLRGGFALPSREGMLLQSI